MPDQSIDGRRLRFLTGIHEFARKAIWIECARYLNPHNVVRVFAPRIEAGNTIRPTDTYFLDPRKPLANGLNESFNGLLPDGCLSRWALA